MLEHPKCRSTWDNMPCIGACYHLSYFELSAFLVRLPVGLPHIKAGPNTLCLDPPQFWILFLFQLRQASTVITVTLLLKKCSAMLVFLVTN